MREHKGGDGRGRRMHINARIQVPLQVDILDLQRQHRLPPRGELWRFHPRGSDRDDDSAPNGPGALGFVPREHADQRYAPRTSPVPERSVFTQKRIR